MPVRIVESGPAAGVIAAAHFGRLAGRTDLISFDMGGTTAKAGLIEDGEVRQASGQELGAGINISRILQGGGYYVGAATADLAEVGAGGGSIAWLDNGGVLKVGPESAGADPGPIAYGLGCKQVTVTDANLLLGRIPADYFLGGEMRVDLENARRIVAESLARPVAISVEEACSAIVDVASANMLKMLRIVTAESIEMDYPVRILRYELVPDSGGSGAHRGGLGLLREYEMLAESATVNVRGDRAAFAPRGFYGGADGSFSTFYLLRSDGSTEKIPSKYSGRIKRGERLRIMTPSGGGFGEPGKRDRDALRDDYLNGKLSPERIEREYGVKVTALTE